MKKTILFTCISITTLHAMNNTSPKIISTFLGVQSHGTEINLFKGSAYDPNDQSLISVVGKNEQEILVGKKNNLYLPKFSFIGDTYFAAFRYCIYDYKDNSDDNTYKPYSCPNEQQPWLDGKNDFCAFFIEEPCISQQNKVFIYVVKRKSIYNKNIIIQYHFSHDNAIKEASKDLAMCYTNALTEVLTICKTTYGPPCTIALPALSTDTGFPRDKAAPIAINTVIEFTKNNPGKYKTINLFVKKRFEFALYKKLLKTYVLSPKLSLLYYSPKDHNSVFSILPNDLIKYIGHLTIDNEYD